MSELLDPETVERVVRRAQELTRAGEDDDAVRPGTIDESVLLEAAAEVGIEPVALRRALALERLEVASGPSRGDRVLGPPTVSRTRVLDVDADDVLDRLDAWLTSSGRLVAVRRAGGTVEWVPRTGIWTALHHLRRPPLTPSAQKADRVVADVRAVPVPSPASASSRSSPSSSVVRVTVDRRSDRRSSGNAGLAVSGAGAVGSLAALTVLVPGFLVVSIPAMGLGGWLAGSGRRRADAVADELDKLLDVVEAGDRPPSMTDRLRRRPNSAE